MRTFFRSGAAVGVAALLAGLFGCTTKAAQTAAQSKTQTDSKTLRVGFSIEPTFLDPARVQDVNTGELLMHCFETLVRVNKNNALEPALAEKWELSADGKTYTFHLRPNVRFHNGRLLTTDDVKYSWERAVAPETRSPIAVNYLDGIVGLQDFAAGKTKTLAGVKIINPQTLTVTLDRPRAYFLSLLAYNTNAIVCREAVQASGGKFDAQSVIGTGAFRLTEYTPGQKIVLESFAEYWGGKPTLDRIELPILLSGEAQYNSFRAGAIDVVGGVPLSRYTQDKAQGQYSAEYHILPSANTTYLVLQQERQPLFARKQIRQAFAHAIDRDRILKVAGRGVVRPAVGFVPPELLPASSPNALPYDPAKAKQLLAQAGFPDGKGFPAITLSIIQQSTEVLEAATLIQSDLKRNLGLEIKIQEREAGEYYKATNRRELECYIASWYADYPDPQNFLSTLLITGVALNRSGYSNPQFDQLCRQADQEPKPAKRAALYAQADRLVVSEAGVIPLSHAPRLLLVRQGITGWEANSCNVLPFHRVTKRSTDDTEKHR
jgi:oligopeptide transport system substrate-binding protein